jgi:hypothetical protein
LRKRIRGWLIVLGVAAGLVAAGRYDATRFEPDHPRLYRVEVPIVGLPHALEGLRIVQLSDVHMVSLGKREERALALVHEAKPDLIVLSGDYVGDGGITPGYDPGRSAASFQRFLQSLQAEYGVFGVAGNWDPVGRGWCRGAEMLENEGRAIEVGEARVWVAGVPTVKTDLQGALRGRPENASVCILLAHVPATGAEAAELPHPPDLILCGHSHGGQTALPFLAEFPYGCEKYRRGLYRVEGSWLYVNRGLGMHSVPVRFLCRAEVTLLTLKRAD